MIRHIIHYGLHFVAPFIIAFVFFRNKNPWQVVIIICGDFNNTQNSYPYRIIQGDLIDTFDEKGAGFGTTFDFQGFPLKIDHILVDEQFTVLAHKNYQEELSDHFPVCARLELH